MKVKEESENPGLKLHIKKLRSWPLFTLQQVDRETMETVTDFSSILGIIARWATF